MLDIERKVNEDYKHTIKNMEQMGVQLMKKLDRLQRKIRSLTASENQLNLDVKFMSNLLSEKIHEINLLKFDLNSKKSAG